MPKDLYTNLMAVGSVEIVTSGSGDGGDAKPPAPAPARLSFDAASARDWWGGFVFGKTYVERRSLFTMYRRVAGRRWRHCWLGSRQEQAGHKGAGPGTPWLLLPPPCPPLRPPPHICMRMHTFAALPTHSQVPEVLVAQPHTFPCCAVPRCAVLCRTFFRIWAFLILEFHFMCVMLWGWPATKRGSYYALCSVPCNHAFLSLAEQVAGAWTQRAPGGFKGRGARLEGLCGAAGVCGWACRRALLCPHVCRNSGPCPLPERCRLLPPLSSLPPVRPPLPACLQPRASVCWGAPSGAATATASSTGWR